MPPKLTANGSRIFRVLRRDRRERGNAILEFAVVLPVLVLLALGICQYGVIFSTFLSLRNAATMAARFATVQQPSGTTPDDAAIGTYANQVASQSLDPTGLVPPPSSIPHPTIAGAKLVTITYRLQTFFPVPGTGNDGVFLLTAQSVMR